MSQKGKAAFANGRAGGKFSTVMIPATPFLRFMK
jgi:hypothetical protein